MKMIFLYALLVGESIYFCGLWPLMNHLPRGGWIKNVFKYRGVWGYVKYHISAQKTRPQIGLL